MSSPNEKLWSPTRCAVVGATGGIGGAFAQHLLEQTGVEQIYGLARRADVIASQSNFTPIRLDYAEEASIESAAEQIKPDGPLDLVIIATGLLHDLDGFGPEKSLRDLKSENLVRSYLVNAVGPALVAKHFLPLLRRDGKSVFAALSARIGSISDNRIGGWYGYRAAKSGLNQLLKTASVEHRRRWPESVVIGLHPGTVDTNLSKPFQRNVSEGKLFTSDYAAQSMLRVIASVTSEDTGKVFAYDGTEVPA